MAISYTKSMTISGNTASFRFDNSYYNINITKVNLGINNANSGAYYPVEISGNGNDNGTIWPYGITGVIEITGFEGSYYGGNSLSFTVSFSYASSSSLGRCTIEFTADGGDTPFIRYNGNLLYAVTFTQISYSASLSGTYYLKNEDGGYDAITLPNAWAPTNVPYYTRTVSSSPLYKR